MVLSRQGRDGGDRLGGYQGRAAECKRAGLSWVKCKGPTTACHARRRRVLFVARALARRLEAQPMTQIEDRCLAGANGLGRDIGEDEAASIAILPDRPRHPREPSRRMRSSNVSGADGTRRTEAPPGERSRMVHSMNCEQPATKACAASRTRLRRVARRSRDTVMAKPFLGRFDCSKREQAGRFEPMPKRKRSLEG